MFIKLLFYLSNLVTIDVVSNEQRYVTQNNTLLLDNSSLKGHISSFVCFVLSSRPGKANAMPFLL